MPSKIRLLVIGKIKEPYLAAGITEYEKRLRPYCKLEIIELKDQGMEKEARKIEKYLEGGPSSPSTFILDAAGKPLDSVEFSKLIKAAELSPSPLTFIIGGPYGVDERLKARARLLSLSKMTFTHEMCRLFLLEQIYRAYQIAQNRPYHR
jgi:23S rRNA (pseudouridine1915-N3)-methyltransferase